MVVSRPPARTTPRALLVRDTRLCIGQMQPPRLFIDLLEGILRIHISWWSHSTTQRSVFAYGTATIGRQPPALPSW